MIEQPVLKPDPENNKYVLVEDFEYIWTVKKTKYLIKIPYGFQFEASIPRIAWSILGLTPGHPKVLAAACVHDWIYKHGGNIFIKHKPSYWTGIETWGDFYEKITRKQTDKLFFRIMRENGVKKFKRRAAYRAVRLFGGSSWTYSM